jgi:hypothetical protein
MRFYGCLAKNFGTKLLGKSETCCMFSKPCQAIQPKGRYSYISVTVNQREVAIRIVLAICWLLAWLVLRTSRRRWRSSETSVDFQHTTRSYTTEERTLHNHSCKNIKSYKMKSWMTLDSVEIGFVSLMQCSIIVVVWYTKPFRGLIHSVSQHWTVCSFIHANCLCLIPTSG